MASARSTKPTPGWVIILRWIVLLAFAAAVGAGLYFAVPALVSMSYGSDTASSTLSKLLPKREPEAPKLDVMDYRKRLLTLAQVATSSPYYKAFLQGTTTATGTIPLWPALHNPEPLAGAILPFKRVVAYYGNFYSKQMGALGEYDKGTVIAKLKSEAAAWEAADPTTPVMPAIEYIDVTAQGSAGKDGKYRLRMPDSQIDIALDYAKAVDGIVILDIQPGLSTVQDEVPLLDTYLNMPQVHLALDPEFAMHNGAKPGTVIGSLDASDINWAINYLSKIVKDNNLPPKILVIHRFTGNMVTNAALIQPTAEVQVVMQMDGWGSPQRKKNTFYHVVAPEPVQFAGVKLFYKNDLKEDPPRLLTKEEVLDLKPTPIFIQYQ